MKDENLKSLKNFMTNLEKKIFLKNVLNVNKFIQQNLNSFLDIAIEKMVLTPGVKNVRKIMIK